MNFTFAYYGYSVFSFEKKCFRHLMMAASFLTSWTLFELTVSHTDGSTILGSTEPGWLKLKSIHKFVPPDPSSVFCSYHVKLSESFEKSKSKLTWSCLPRSKVTKSVYTRNWECTITLRSCLFDLGSKLTLFSTRKESSLQSWFKAETNLLSVATASTITSLPLERLACESLLFWKKTLITCFIWMNFANWDSYTFIVARELLNPSCCSISSMQSESIEFEYSPERISLYLAIDEYQNEVLAHWFKYWSFSTEFHWFDINSFSNQTEKKSRKPVTLLLTSNLNFKSISVH